MKTRMSRLTSAERNEIETLSRRLEDPAITPEEKNMLFSRFGSLFSKTDSYDPINEFGESVDCQADIFNSVWPEAAAMRKSGKLLELGRSIRCPVLAIHGDYDPHPADGIETPLSHVLQAKDFRFILLKRCGHSPWQERTARSEFYKILNAECADLQNL
jgi:pimeloyl-ACP methyl ester carboxylesterase